MPPVGFETTISGGQRPQIYASDRAATRTGTDITYMLINKVSRKMFLRQNDLLLVKSKRNESKKEIRNTNRECLSLYVAS